MPSFNKVILMGNLTKDPRIGSTPSGSSVCDFSIAMNRKYTLNDQDKEEVCYVDIVTWGKQAESCGKYLQKGSPVFIEGRLKTDMWNDKEGNKRSKLLVTAERIQFLSSNKSEDRMSQHSSDSSDSHDSGHSYSEEPRQTYKPNVQRQETRQAMPVPPQPKDIFVDNIENEDDIPF